MVQSGEASAANYPQQQRRLELLALSGCESQRVSSMETRHFMIAGCPGVGKTSLLLTVARGVYPPDESAVPRRFEGWSVTVSGPKVDAEAAKGEKSKLQRTQLAVQRCHSLGSAPTASSSVPARATTSYPPSAAPAPATRGAPPVNLVLWEDWPRKTPEKRDDAEQDGSDSDDPSSEEDEDDDEGHHEDLVEPDFRKLEMERDPVTGRTTLTPRLHPKHRVLRATPSNKSEASADNCFPPPPPPCQPERPCLSPRPNVIMLCFAQGDVDTFVEAETVIFPELTGRYPHVPVILCATKCDDESVSNGEDGAGAATAAMVAPTSGNGDLAVINEEDSKSCPVGAAAAASRKFGVSTEMGIAMSRRIGARAYIECSAKTMKGLPPILQEAYRCAVLEAGATAGGASATNGHGGFGAFPSLIRKKNSAPSFLFNSSSSSLSASASGTPGGKKKSGKTMMGRKSAASFLKRSKAASLHLINKNSNQDGK